MDPLSVIASVAGLIALTIKTAAALESYKMHVKSAPAEIQTLVEELQNLTGILSNVEETFKANTNRDATKRDGDEKDDKHEGVTSIQGLPSGNVQTIVNTINGCRAHLLKAMAALQEYGIVSAAEESPEGASSGPTQRSKFKMLFKRMKYPFDRENIQTLLTVIRDYKATITLALSLEGKKSLDVLQTTLSRLETASTQYDASLSSIREQNNQLLTALISAMDGIKPPPYSESAAPQAPLVQHFEVPQQPTATFVGRRDVLQEIEVHFQRDSTLPEQRRCAIYGLGGSGKTQIALKHAFSHRHDYHHVFFVNAASQDTAVQGFAKIHSLLQLGQANSDQDKVEIVRRWFSQSGNTRWLLIFDNADDLDGVDLWSFIPVVDAGDILITTRDGRIDDPELSTLAIPLDMLSQEDALELLRRRSGVKAPLNEAQIGPATSIAQELGFLPLAIDQAAAYIQARKKSFADYLALYRKQQDALLSYRSRLSKQQQTVLTTWEVSFRRLEEDSPAVAELLLLLCHYDNTYISDTMLKRGTTPQLSYGRDGEEVQFPPEKSGVPQTLIALVSDEIGYDDAVEKLRSFSLVQRTAGETGFVLHPLVQFCGQQRAGGDTLRASFSAALRLLSHAFPRGGLDDWYVGPIFEAPEYGQLESLADNHRRNTSFSIEFLPQVQHFCLQLEEALAKGDDLQSLSFTATSLLGSAYHFASTQWCERFVKVCEALLPLMSPDGGYDGLMTDYGFLLAFITERRGKISAALGEPENGIDVLSNFVKNRPNIAGVPSATDPSLHRPNHLANSMHGCVYVLLAQKLIDLGRELEALPYLLAWKPFDPPSLSERGVIRYRDRTLANLYIAEGKWAEGEAVLRNLLSPSMQDATSYAGTLGEGWTIQQLAEILMETGRPAEAATLLIPAIAAREAAGNTDREDTVLLMLDLIASLLDQKSLDVALTQLAKLRGVMARKTAGAKQNSAAESQETLGAFSQMWCLVARLSCYLENWSEAEASWEKAVETLQQVQRLDGFMMAAARASLAYTRWKTGRLGNEGEAKAQIAAF
ncbi:Regulatory protein AfsR, partial [Madurella mycetomatis]